jgi:putative phosphoesterase
MKIGLIADIHAHLSHLQDALLLLENKGVDHILCAGDIVDGGEDGDAVVAMLREKQIPCVQGNHDRDAFADQAWIRRNLRTTGEATHPFLLTLETTAYVASLPLLQELTFAGVRICLTHGTPWSNTTYLFPDMDERHFHQVSAATQADVIVLGHTHLPMCIRIGGRWIVNPGSVSLNRVDETRTCAVLHVPEFAFEVFDLSTQNRIPVAIRHISQL